MFWFLFKVFKAQILRKYLRQSCGSFWSGLDLRRPTFHRFRLIVPYCFMFFCVFVSVFCYQAGFLATPRPFPNERSLNSHILRAPKTLIGQDLTQFYLTLTLGLHLCKRPAIYARCWMKESPPEKREGSCASVLVTESIVSLSIDHFPSFRW